MIAYKKVSVARDDKLVEELLSLSKAWADELSCPAYYESFLAVFKIHEFVVH